MHQYLAKLFFAAMAATLAWIVVTAGAPALAQGMADDSACLEEFLSGEEFGLCNAYCEAMDCDGDNPQASAKACEKVRLKFEDIALVDELPCLAEPSPNDPPTLDLNAVDGPGETGSTATFVSFGDAVPIAVDVMIEDDGETIISATVTLKNALDDPDETLSLSPAGHDLLVGLVGGAVTGEGTASLTITGDGLLAQYEELLQEVVYDNALASPDTTAARIITVEVEDDGFGVSDAATSVVAVEVGCPCPGYTSKFVRGPDLANMYRATAYNARALAGGPGVSSAPGLNGPAEAACVTRSFVRAAYGEQLDVTITFEIEPPRRWRFETNDSTHPGGLSCALTLSNNTTEGSIAYAELRKLIPGANFDLPYVNYEPLFDEPMLSACRAAASLQAAGIVSLLAEFEVPECSP